MKKNVIVAVAALLVALPVCSNSSGQKPDAQKGALPEIVRGASVAGQFYPSDKGELEKTVDKFLSDAKPPKTDGELLAMVAPHAGYPYSGQAAAFAYKELSGKQIDTVILIGNSHHERFEGASVFAKGSWLSPLGRMEVDADLSGKLIDANPRIFFKESAHGPEHSLEVQLPFLQRTLKNFKIVPILLGNAGGSDPQMLADAIIKNIKGKNVLIVASSDLSHYPPYKDAKAADAKTVQGILSGDVKKFKETVSRLEKTGVPGAVTFACGSEAIETVMLVAKGMGADKIQLLSAANSGDVAPGDKSRVVGYAAVGFYGPRRGGALNEDEQHKLLEVAKKTVTELVTGKKIPKFKFDEPALNQKLGAFVTLKKNGQLRGCIGRFSPTDIPLYEVVSEMAVAAASQDPRFSPVGHGELKDLTYEVSVLSVPEKIASWKDVVLGKHGVIIDKGGHRGVFLPQVAAEFNMSIGDFLGELCNQKAGLPRDCYSDPNVNLSVFTAQVFGD